MKKFLQNLRERYGDISWQAVIARYKPTTTETFVDFTENPFDTPTTPQYHREPPTTPQRYREPAQPGQPSQSQQSPTSQTQPEYPPPPPKSSLVIDIKSARDWVSFRERVKDLSTLTNFFTGKRDSQSPMFLKLIQKYQQELGNELTFPKQGIDADASINFVEKLAAVIKKRLFDVLKACQRGLAGKGEMPADFYKNIKFRLAIYFKSIGLVESRIDKNTDFKAVIDRMEAVTKKPTPNPFLRGKIAEVSIHPLYFNYRDADNAVQKFWLDGQCIVFD